MTASTIWWLLAGTAVGVELVTGTFYLLMVALGLAGGAVAAHLGAGPTAQLVVAALIATVASVALGVRRSRLPGALPAQANRDVNLDIGERVDVGAWNDHTARVNHRGASWQVRLRPGAEPHPGPHRITAVEGNVLIVTPD